MGGLVIVAAQLENLKKRFKRALPDVKHTHRLEAMARGLSFRTYSSLLAKLNTEGQATIVLNDDAFNDYLVEHGFGDGDAMSMKDIAKMSMPDEETV